MDAIRLHDDKGGPLDVWLCSKCNYLTLGPTHRNSQEAAEACCRPPKCEICGKDVEPKAGYSGFRQCHAECESAKRERDKRATMAKAEEVTGYTGWVYCEGLERHNDGFFKSADEIPDYVAGMDDDFPRPAFAYCCEEVHHSISLDNIIENLCDDAHEGMPDYLDTKDLGKAIDAFNELNKSAMVSYYADHKRKVRIDYSSVADTETRAGS